MRKALATQILCWSVSGTALPRAADVLIQASTSGTPSSTRTPVAIMPARLILARPPRIFSTRWVHSLLVASIDAGTPRSGIGNRSKEIPAWRVRPASSNSPVSRSSKSSSRETTSVSPAAAQSAISSASHSPGRGRPRIARRPGAKSRKRPLVTGRSGSKVLLAKWTQAANSGQSSRQEDRPEAVARYSADVGHRCGPGVRRIWY